MAKDKNKGRFSQIAEATTVNAPQQGVTCYKYTYEDGRSPIDKQLKDRNLETMVQTRLARIERQGVNGLVMGNVRNVGSGVSEMKFDVGPGYRLYFANHNGGVCLLGFGNKSTQQRDIDNAIALAKELSKDKSRKHEVYAETKPSGARNTSEEGRDVEAPAKGFHYGKRGRSGM